MAIIELSPGFEGLSGRSGNLVYRQCYGTTVVAARPTLPKRRTVSPAQQAQRDRFDAARWYARTVLSDPWHRRLYEQRAKALNRRVDRLVISDFLTPPTVGEIDASAYQRRAGGLIRVLASDDIEVVSVEVAIHTATGVLVERGLATPQHGVWCYRTTAPAPATEALQITATAKDRPGHPGDKTLLLPGNEPAA